MKSPANLFNEFKTVVYKNYGENPGKMLVHTGVLGWILSSLAQVAAVVFNDKISKEQKMFLIPQEMADAAANIISFYIVTNSVKAIGSKLVKTGKLSTPKILAYLEKTGIPVKAKKGVQSPVGKWDFDITKLANFDEIAGDFKPFKNGVDVGASLVGSIISSNIITPIIRNKYASERQKSSIAKMKAQQMNNLERPKGISLAEYQNRAALHYSSGSLKI